MVEQFPLKEEVDGSNPSRLTRMIDYKSLFSVLAVVLTLVAYIPYLRSILKGQTKPHMYSWLVWFVDSLIIFILQLTNNAGPGAYVTLAAAVMCFIVLILSFSKGTKDIKKVDGIFLITAFIALGLWWFAKQPLLSAILITGVDLFGFAPTVRKAWRAPNSETATFYFINSIRFVLAILALSQYSIINMIYPATWLVANGLFGISLVLRRKS